MKLDLLDPAANLGHERAKVYQLLAQLTSVANADPASMGIAINALLETLQHIGRQEAAQALLPILTATAKTIDDNLRRLGIELP